MMSLAVPTMGQPEVQLLLELEEDTLYVDEDFAPHKSSLAVAGGQKLEAMKVTQWRRSMEASSAPLKTEAGDVTDLECSGNIDLENTLMNRISVDVLGTCGAVL